MPIIQTVNVGRKQPNPHKDVGFTGINKQPRSDAVEVRAPGARSNGGGSGILDDFIGDTAHHGGDDQALYAFEREDLDRWQVRLDRELPNGFFGENLTTLGLDVNGARLGEIWRIGGTLEVRVTSPRVPCSTFRGWVGEPGWLKTFTQDARPGAYLSIVTPGFVSPSDTVSVVHKPDHNVTVSMTYMAMTTHRELLPELLAAGNDLLPGLRELASGGAAIRLD